MHHNPHKAQGSRAALPNDRQLKRGSSASTAMIMNARVCNTATAWYVLNLQQKH
jgi:hypothetical protein